MKTKLMFAAILVLFALTPLVASAATFEGTIQGYQCVTQGKTCPVGQEDPMAAVENVFVLLANNNDYYFINNVDRAVLARHINDVVRVNGDLDSRFKSIKADSIEVMKNGSWAKVWTPGMEDMINGTIYRGHL